MPPTKMAHENSDWEEVLYFIRVKLRSHENLFELTGYLYYKLLHWYTNNHDSKYN